MRNRVVGIVVVLLVLAGAGFAGWYFLVRSDPQPEAAITKTPVATSSTSSIAGAYSVAPAPDNFVGYRVQEQFAAATIESTATGRTNGVTGTMTIDGTTVTEVDVTADLTTLTSDKAQRDNRIKAQGLESAQFPEATFVLVEPMKLASPEAGKTVKTTAVGDFTLHGVTKRVDIPVEGRWDGTRVQVVGNLPIEFADYAMQAPNVGGFVSVQDRGEMEFQLFFTKT